MLRPRSTLLALSVAVVLLAPAAAHGQRHRTGFIRIVSSTNGAAVTIDGQEAGVVPLAEPIEVRAGEHALQISKRGFTSYNEEIRVRANQTRDVEIDLLPLSGFLRVRAQQEEVRVFVDGNFIGNAPVEFDLSPGPHSIKASKAGFRDFLRNVTAEAGAEIDFEATLEPLPADENPYVRRPPRPARWYEKSWVWITVGAVVVAATTATIVGLTVANEESEIDAFCQGPPPCAARVDFR